MQHDQRFLHLFVVYMQHDKELLDPRGRTPLHLAVSLGFVDCVKCLLRSGCDANAINRDGWNGRKFKKKMLKGARALGSFYWSPGLMGLYTSLRNLP